MLNQVLNIQSGKSREKVVDRFCKIIAFLAFNLVIVYALLNMLLLSAVCSVIGVLFTLFIIFNRKGRTDISRFIIICTSIIGVLTFSLFLGFSSGTYLYILVAPLLTYLLYDYNEIKKIIGIFFAYFLTFAVLYLVDYFGVKPLYKLDPQTIHWIFIYNLCSTFILLFSIVTYFASSSFHSISDLKIHQAELEKEILRREESERKLKETLVDREELLAEIHHRVKNNLTMISALINLQLSELNEKEKNSQQSILYSTKNRIYVIALVHNLIYQNKEIDRVNFEKFVITYFEVLKNDFPKLGSLEYHTEIDNEILVDLGTAIPLALIFNEVINYCFLGQYEIQLNDKIAVHLTKSDNNKIRLTILNESLEVESNRCEFDAVSKQIINALVEQLEGELIFTPSARNEFSLQFPYSVHRNIES